MSLENRLQPIQSLGDDRLMGNFLRYEAYWIRNEYSSTEASFAPISMQVEQGLVRIEQLTPESARLS